MPRARRFRAATAILAAGLSAGGCAPTRGPAELALAPEALRRELGRRVGPDSAREVPVFFDVPAEAVALARREVERASPGRERIERLVALLRRDPPGGFGLRYDAARTATAREALAGGSGNCMTLASLLVGLARGLGWRAYYAEAGDPQEANLLEADLDVLADHMVVVVVGGGDRAVVDFLGAVEGRPLRILDDLQATGHFLNNRAFERVWLARRSGVPVPWQAVAEDFERATRVDPSSARAWNNLGIAWARLGRSGDARRAYIRARMLDAELSSPERNLRALRTRQADGAEPSVEGYPGAP